MSFSYVAIIQYWGNRYFGWQKQPKHPSIQQTLENVLKIVTNSESIKTKASGRTDAGVHALAQVVRIDIPHDIPAPNLMKACNNLLPEDIKIDSLKPSSSEFCPQRHAISKQYNYNFFLKSSKTQSSIFQDLYIYRVKDNLDIDLMNQACLLFIGRHDFSHFYCEGTPVKTFIREVFSCRIKKSLNSQSADYFTLVISGNGFLKQMVRLIMGAVWAVGAGKLDLTELKAAIESPKLIKKRHLAPLAPAKGLLLHHVTYSENLSD